MLGKARGIWRRFRMPTSSESRGCWSMSSRQPEELMIAALRIATGRVGDCYDKALAEPWFATLVCELIDRQPSARFDGAGLSVTGGVRIPGNRVAGCRINPRSSVKIHRESGATASGSPRFDHHTGSQQDYFRPIVCVHQSGGTSWSL